VRSGRWSGVESLHAFQKNGEGERSVKRALGLWSGSQRMIERLTGRALEIIKSEILTFLYSGISNKLGFLII
jgi:hypothetical protein